MSTKGMAFELRKKFEGMEFRNLYELAIMTVRYEKILLDEQEMKNSSKGTYYKDPNLKVLITEYNIDLEEVDMAKLIYKWPMVCKALHRAMRALKALQLLRRKPSIYYTSKN